MKLSVVIPCLNAADTLAAQLEALANERWNHPWEVIVADNGSTDDSLTIVETYKPRIPNLRVVDASQRKGQPHALNTGAASATGDSVVFCDADDEIAPGWIEAMGNALLDHPFVACRVDFTKLNEHWVQNVFQDHPQIRGLQKAWYPPYLPHAGGGTIGVRKRLWESVGGFDDALPYLHDTDFCFKVQLKGVPVHFVPEAVLHIRCRATVTGLFRQAQRWAEYSVLVYKKYRPLDVNDSWRWKVFLRQCKRLLYSARAIHSQRGRAQWLWQCGWQIGRLIGSLKHHVPPV